MAEQDLGLLLNNMGITLKSIDQQLAELPHMKEKLVLLLNSLPKTLSIELKSATDNLDNSSKNLNNASKSLENSTKEVNDLKKELKDRAKKDPKEKQKENKEMFKSFGKVMGKYTADKKIDFFDKGMSVNLSDEAIKKLSKSNMSFWEKRKNEMEDYKGLNIVDVLKKFKQGPKGSLFIDIIKGVMGFGAVAALWGSRKQIWGMLKKMGLVEDWYDEDGKTRHAFTKNDKSLLGVLGYGIMEGAKKLWEPIGSSLGTWWDETGEATVRIQLTNIRDTLWKDIKSIFSKAVFSGDNTLNWKGILGLGIAGLGASLLLNPVGAISTLGPAAGFILGNPLVLSGLLAVGLTAWAAEKLVENGKKMRDVGSKLEIANAMDALKSMKKIGTKETIKQTASSLKDVKALETGKGKEFVIEQLRAAQFSSIQNELKNSSEKDRKKLTEYITELQVSREKLSDEYNKISKDLDKSVSDAEKKQLKRQLLTIEVMVESQNRLADNLSAMKGDGAALKDYFTQRDRIVALEMEKAAKFGFDNVVTGTSTSYNQFGIQTQNTFGKRAQTSIEKAENIAFNIEKNTVKASEIYKNILKARETEEALYKTNDAIVSPIGKSQRPSAIQNTMFDKKDEFFKNSDGTLIAAKSGGVLDKSIDNVDLHVQELKPVMEKIENGIDNLVGLTSQTLQAASQPQTTGQPLPPVTSGDGREPSSDKAYAFRARVHELLFA